MEFVDYIFCVVRIFLRCIFRVCLQFATKYFFLLVNQILSTLVACRCLLLFIFRLWFGQIASYICNVCAICDLSTRASNKRPSRNNCMRSKCVRFILYHNVFCTVITTPYNDCLEEDGSLSELICAV